MAPLLKWPSPCETDTSPKRINLVILYLPKWILYDCGCCRGLQSSEALKNPGWVMQLYISNEIPEKVGKSFALEPSVVFVLLSKWRLRFMSPSPSFHRFLGAPGKPQKPPSDAGRMRKRSAAGPHHLSHTQESGIFNLDRALLRGSFQELYVGTR